MIILTIKQIKIHDIYTDSLSERFVRLPHIQLGAENACPVIKCPLSEIIFELYLHLNIDNSVIDPHLKVETAELLLGILGRQLNIVYVYFLYAFSRYFKQIGNERRNDPFISLVTKDSLENNIELKL